MSTHTQQAMARIQRRIARMKQQVSALDDQVILHHQQAAATGQRELYEQADRLASEADAIATQVLQLSQRLEALTRRGGAKRGHLPCFGAVVSKIRQFNQQVREMEQDPLNQVYGHYGPSARWIAGEQDRILAPYGLTRREYNEELYHRTSSHFCTFSNCQAEWREGWELR